jgi:MoaA/NifB/PqqE/SkfB family radical SAM enzyme
VSCSPNYEDSLSLSTIKKAIDEAYKIPSIKLVVFTGGESSLFPDILEEGIKYVAEHGFITRLVSNAWWADSLSRAMDNIGRWKACGLEELNISYDDFHIPYLKKYGNEQNIINACKAISEYGIRGLVGCVLTPKAIITTDYLRDMLKRENISGDIKFLEDFLFPLGRARSLPPECFVKADDGSITSRCREAGNSIVILPSNDVTFCCGHLINTAAQRLITIGKLSKNTSLSDLVHKMQNNILFWWLHNKGPFLLLKELGKSPELYRNCEACYYLGTKYFSDLLALAPRSEELLAKMTG